VWRRQQFYNCLGDQRRWFTAAWFLDRLIEEEPARAQWFWWRGIARANLGRWRMALSDLTRATESPGATMQMWSDLVLVQGVIQGVRPIFIQGVRPIFKLFRMVRIHPTPSPSGGSDPINGSTSGDFTDAALKMPCAGQTAPRFQIPPSPLTIRSNVDFKLSFTLRLAGYLSYDRTRKRWIREMSEYQLPLRGCFVSVQLL